MVLRLKRDGGWGVTLNQPPSRFRLHCQQPAPTLLRRTAFSPLEAFAFMPGRTQKFKEGEKRSRGDKMALNKSQR